MYVLSRISMVQVFPRSSRSLSETIRAGRLSDDGRFRREFRIIFHPRFWGKQGDKSVLGFADANIRLGWAVLRRVWFQDGGREEGIQFEGFGGVHSGFAQTVTVAAPISDNEALTPDLPLGGTGNLGDDRCPSDWSCIC